MYKALIADLDGTAVRLTSDGSDVDDRTRKAVRSAQSRGYKIACATGRDWTFASPVIRALGLASPCVIAGGTRIVNAENGDTLWQKSLEPGDSRTVFDIYRTTSPVGFIFSSSHPDRRLLQNVESIPAENSYLYLIGIPENIALAIVSKVNALGTTVAHLTPSWDGPGLFDLHTTHRDGTKANAIWAWHELVGISQEQTIGMGDSGNDLPIFEASGLKVAVSNASQALKDQADYIAPAVIDHGLEHVINRFLLNQA